MPASTGSDNHCTWTELPPCIYHNKQGIVIFLDTAEQVVIDRGMKPLFEIRRLVLQDIPKNGPDFQFTRRLQVPTAPGAGAGASTPGRASGGRGRGRGAAVTDNMQAMLQQQLAQQQQQLAQHNVMMQMMQASQLSNILFQSPNNLAGLVQLVRAAGSGAPAAAAVLPTAGSGAAAVLPSVGTGATSGAVSTSTAREEGVRSSALGAARVGAGAAGAACAGTETSISLLPQQLSLPTAATAHSRATASGAVNGSGTARSAISQSTTERPAGSIYTY